MGNSTQQHITARAAAMEALNAVKIAIEDGHLGTKEVMQAIPVPSPWHGMSDSSIAAQTQGQQRQINEGLRGHLDSMGSLHDAAVGQGLINQIDRRPGFKDDMGKARVWSGAFNSFPRALVEIARHTDKGNQQPGHVPDGWLVVPDGFKRYSEAHARHCMLEALTQHPDDLFEAVVTVSWNGLARLEHLCKDRDRGEG